MTQCGSCNDPIANPTYVDGGDWYCSLECWKVARRVSNMTKFEDSDAYTPNRSE